MFYSRLPSTTFKVCRAFIFLFFFLHQWRRFASTGGWPTLGFPRNKFPPPKNLRTHHRRMRTHTVTLSSHSNKSECSFLRCTRTQQSRQGQQRRWKDGRKFRYPKVDRVFYLLSPLGRSVPSFAQQTCTKHSQRTADTGNPIFFRRRNHRFHGI